MTGDAVETFDVVVVGGGPRAVSLVQRLTARLRERARLESGSVPGPTVPLLSVALIDAVEAGAGATWRTDQTAQFLNNTTASETTIYPDGSTPIDGPLGGGPDFVEWASALAQRDSHETSWAIDEAREVAPDTFPTRRLQGIYYAEQLARAEAEGFVSVHRVIGLALDVEREDDFEGGARRVVRLADGRRLSARRLVLAQGMVQAEPDAAIRGFADAADRLGLRYLEPGMPAERPWHELPADENCILQGLGANFFDVVAELTAGRGGRFEAVAGDPLCRLRYSPSGAEPRLFAVSRRGVPYRSKGVWGPEGRPRYGAPAIADPDWFAALERSGKQLHFGRDVWPRIAAELSHAFAAALAARDASAVPEGVDPLREELLAELAALRESSPEREGAAEAANARIDAILARRIDRLEGHPEAFRMLSLHRPTGGCRVSEREWRASIDGLIDAELDSIAHPLESPRQAVNLAMGALRGRVGRLVSLGLIEGGSVVSEVQDWFDADGLFLASGPPPGRTRQVLALIEAGVLQLVGPESRVEIDENEGRFVAFSPITGIRVSARVFAETRMSKGKVSRTDDPLLRALLDTGRGRMHRLPACGSDGSDGTVPTESIEAVSPGGAEAPLALVASDGTVDPRILLLGIPVSSTQPGSAIGAAPGVPSPLLTGTDIAARAIIAELIDGRIPGSAR